MLIAIVNGKMEQPHQVEHRNRIAREAAVLVLLPQSESGIEPLLLVRGLVAMASLAEFFYCEFGAAVVEFDAIR